MQRRHFLKTASLGVAGAAAAPFVSTSQAHANETYNWDMVTSWPKNFPALGTGANDPTDDRQGQGPWRIPVDDVWRAHIGMMRRRARR